MQNILKAVGGTLMIGAAMAAAGCSGGDKAGNASNSVTSNTAAEVPIGNDPTAQEMVANQPAAEPATETSTPATGSTNSAGTADNAATPAADADGETTGGDTGGNSAEKEIPGM